MLDRWANALTPDVQGCVTTLTATTGCWTSCRVVSGERLTQTEIQEF